MRADACLSGTAPRSVAPHRVCHTAWHSPTPSCHPAHRHTRACMKHISRCVNTSHHLAKRINPVSTHSLFQRRRTNTFSPSQPELGMRRWSWRNGFNITALSSMNYAIPMKYHDSVHKTYKNQYVYMSEIKNWKCENGMLYQITSHQ